MVDVNLSSNTVELDTGNVNGNGKVYLTPAYAVEVAIKLIETAIQVNPEVLTELKIAGNYDTIALETLKHGIKFIHPPKPIKTVTMPVPEDLGEVVYWLSQLYKANPNMTADYIFAKLHSEGFGFKLNAELAEKLKQFHAEFMQRRQAGVE